MLTQRRQQQALANLIHGHDPALDLSALQPPYDYIFDYIDGYDTQEAYQLLLRLKLINDKFSATIDNILSLEPGLKYQHESLADIGPTLPDIMWLWPGWLPQGLMSLLAAWPGVGKTYFALDLARRLADGLPAPDGQDLHHHSQNVIYVDAENFLPAIHARAQAWGMDSSTFYPIRRPPRDLIDMANVEYQDTLVDMCYDLRPALVIIDSLSSVNLKGENNVEDLREVLSFFTELPQAFNCALLLIHHLRKPSKGHTQPVTMHDLRGSGHLVAMARSILAIDVIRTGPDDDPNGPRQLKVVKSNLARYPRPLAVQYQPSPANPDIAVLEYGKIDFWLPPSETLTEQCIDWLIEILSRGPRSYQELLKLAQEEGYKENVLQEARKSMGRTIVDTVGKQRKGNKWALNTDAPLGASTSDDMT